MRQGVTSDAVRVVVHAAVVHSHAQAQRRAVARAPGVAAQQRGQMMYQRVEKPFRLDIRRHHNKRPIAAVFVVAVPPGQAGDAESTGE